MERSAAIADRSRPRGGLKYPDVRRSSQCLLRRQNSGRTSSSCWIKPAVTSASDGCRRSKAPPSPSPKRSWSPVSCGARARASLSCCNGWIRRSARPFTKPWSSTRSTAAASGWPPSASAKDDSGPGKPQAHRGISSPENTRDGNAAGTTRLPRIGTRQYCSVDGREDRRRFRVLDGERSQEVEVIAERIVIRVSEGQVAVCKEAYRDAGRVRRHLAFVPVRIDRKAERPLVLG